MIKEIGLHIPENTGETSLNKSLQDHETYYMIHISSLQTTTEPNSKEVFEEVLNRLQALGSKGKRVLVKLHETMGVEYKEKVRNINRSTVLMIFGQCLLS